MTVKENDSPVPLTERRRPNLHSKIPSFALKIALLQKCFSYGE